MAGFCSLSALADQGGRSYNQTTATITSGCSRTSIPLAKAPFLSQAFLDQSAWSSQHHYGRSGFWSPLTNVYSQTSSVEERPLLA